MKIVVLDGYTLNPGDLSWDALKTLGECKIYDRTSLTDDAEIISRIGDAEIVITNKTPLTKKILDACQVKYIGVLATGYNVVDIEAAKEKNIPVTNIPTYGTQSVAQFA
ncbi:MAG: D-2-hydroxyacid dehydrogenase, partial [Selenomonadaceae bacterium]|nr:D-2-hydroxyacid dehydrogenase [Selenomonadaceae bacterium]